MNGREDEALVHVRKRSIKVLPLVDWTVIVIFTVHHLEIWLESSLYLLNNIAFRRIWVNWLPSFPVVFVPFLEKAMISNSIAGHLVNILHLISVLVRSASFVEKLLVVSVIRPVIFRVGHMGPIVPGWNCA